MSNQPTSGLPPSLTISSRDLARLEALLDSPVLSRHPAAGIDYVHGEDVADDLARRPGNGGFLWPGIGKDEFFRSIALDGPLPRKTFSLGHAKDKRFYMECRAIVPDAAG